MNLNVRTQRSIPSRLNAVALTKYTGVCVVRKKLRIAGIPVKGLVLTDSRGPDGPADRAPGVPGCDRNTRARATMIKTRTPRIHHRAVTFGTVHPRPGTRIRLDVVE